MTKVNFTLSDALERRFRATVFHVMGMKKGNIRKAFEEAIEIWIAKQQQQQQQQQHKQKQK